MVAETLRAVAAEHTPVRRLARAGPRGRWEDVGLALYWAVAEDGVQMGILSTTEYEWGYEFELKTVEGWPVALRIERATDDRVYEATARVGRFPELPGRAERARRLIDVFDHFMTELGKKKKLS